MRALPPAGVRIDPALIEKLRKSLQGIEQLQQLGVYDLTREGREILKFCAASDAVPEDMGALARRLLFAAPSPEVESVVTENAEGEWVLTTFANQSPRMGDWYYAVKFADEVVSTIFDDDPPKYSADELSRIAPERLRECLLNPEIEMTDFGRDLLNDFVWRYRKRKKGGRKGRVSGGIETSGFNEQWDMPARRALARGLEGGLKRPHGRQATPIYARSERDAQIYCALHELRALRKIFGRARVSLERVAALHGLSKSTLENALGGRRGSSQRKAARRKKAMPRR